MTLEIAFLFSLLGVMVVLFLTEKLPVDVTAFAGLSLLVATGLVTSDEAFKGFSSPAVITMLSVFLVSAGLQYTGVAEVLGSRIHRVVGGREILLIVAIMLVAGILSAFMNNIAATAVLLPAVVSLARQAGLSPSRLLMPLAFGAILGGTTTLVGTPPNLLASEVLTDQGLRPFGLFEFAPFGLALLAVGVIFMVTVGRKLLPDQSGGMAEMERANLAEVYQLEESLFSITIPEDSTLVGTTLAESRLGSVLGLQVVSVIRDGDEKLAPGGGYTMSAGDRLVVQGRRSDLQDRLELQDLEVAELGSTTMQSAATSVSGIVVRLTEDSDFLGKTVRDLNVRNRFRVTIVEVRRGGRSQRDGFADLPFEVGDEILALGPVDLINELASRTEVDVVAEGREAIERLEDGLYVLRVSENSPMAGSTVAETRLRERWDLTIVGVVRGEETQLVVSPKEPLHAGDKLLVTGQPAKVAQLLELGQVEVADKAPGASLESGDVTLLEAVVAPRSAAVGHSLRDLAFRKKYGLRALAIWRGGSPIRTGLPDTPLRLGDGLLLHGRRDKIPLLQADPDFVVLTEGDPGPRRPGRAPFAIAALLLMVVLVVAGIFPIQVAAFFAATLVVLTRALHMHEAYRAVEWRAIFLVAAILPVGAAMERTGAAELLACSVAGFAGDAGPYGVLLALMVLSSVLSQGLDGAPTVVLLGPVVISTASQVGMSPYPLMMGVGLAASAAFMTPFSHKANLLVMGAGGYRSLDYLKVGTPLTIVILGILTFMIPLLMPF
jgi:di/tricarboxylate transporter